jgi:hypothetical protein
LPRARTARTGQGRGQTWPRCRSSPVTLPGHTARSHCPVTLPGHTARSHCPVTLPGHTARSLSSARAVHPAALTVYRPHMPGPSPVMATLPKPLSPQLRPPARTQQGGGSRAGREQLVPDVCVCTCSCRSGCSTFHSGFANEYRSVPRCRCDVVSHPVRQHLAPSPSNPWYK